MTDTPTTPDLDDTGDTEGAPDSLRERVADVLNSAFEPSGSPDLDAHRRHSAHQFSGWCYVCQGDTAKLADAALAAVTPELDRLAREARIWCRRANTVMADAVEQTARNMQRAGHLRQRAEQAEAEVARLRAELADAERIMNRDHQQAVRATQGRDEARAADLSFHFTGTGQSHVEVEEWAADLIRRGLAHEPPGRVGFSVFAGDCNGLYIDTPDGQRRLVEPGGYVTVNSRGWFQPADQAARAADTGKETDHG